MATFLPSPGYNTTPRSEPPHTTMQNQSSDLLLAEMHLAAGIMSLLAVLIGTAYAIATKLDKKDRPKAITIAFQVGTVGLVAVGGLAYTVFGAERLGLVLYVFASILISIDYVRRTVPAERIETLMLVLSWVVTSFFLIMHQLMRIVDSIGQLIDVVKRLVH